MRLPEPHTGDAIPGQTLEENERHHILRTLDQTNGRIAGRGGAASLLGLNPSTLRSRMKKLGIPSLRNKR